VGDRPADRHLATGVKAGTEIETEQMVHRHLHIQEVIEQFSCGRAAKSSPSLGFTMP
jgi:hypothetical protein